MKPAAIGVRSHSGWGAIVAVSGSGSAITVVARSRVSVVHPKMRGPFQPYHIAARKKLPNAEEYLARCAAECEDFAAAALREMIDELRAGGYRVVGCAVLTGSGRAMPPLERILAAHPLLHTAEGIFFRKVFHDAFKRLNLRVTDIPERELQDRARAAFGKRAASLCQKIARAGKVLGPPWTTDQKLAALAARVMLAEE